MIGRRNHLTDASRESASTRRVATRPHTSSVPPLRHGLAGGRFTEPFGKAKVDYVVPKKCNCTEEHAVNENDTSRQSLERGGVGS